MNSSPTPEPKQPSILGGVMIVAGTVIGAGMLALPIISAGMWSLWTLLVLMTTFFVMLASANMILRANLRFDPGASFHTLVKNTLGPVWNIVNGLSVGFVLYMLLYAYTSGGGATVRHSLGLDIPQSMVSLLFGGTLAVCIFWSTQVVDRLSTIFVIGMVITFVAAITGMLPALGIEKILTLREAPNAQPTAWFVLAALPYFLTSFCFHASVPSLVKYYGKDEAKIKKCIFYGLLIAGICYTIWIFAGFGVLGRESLRDVYAQGGNINHFLAAVESIIHTPWISYCISIFAFLAVVTSFLGAGLGLFDYIADLLGFDNSFGDRIKTAAITFVPPILGSTIFPNGFIIAIGFAGFAAAIWSVIIPAAIEWKHHRQTGASGGHEASIFTTTHFVKIVLFYGVVTSIFHLLSPDVLDVLPVYR